MSVHRPPPFHPLESQAERCLTLGVLGDAFDKARADANPAPAETPDGAPPPIATGGRVGDPAAWASAAFMLAQGWSTSEVAYWLGCTRSTVWRTLKRSEDLRRRVDEEKARLAADAAGRLAGLREEAVACLDHAVRKRGDVRVAMWLCDRLGLVADARRRGGAADRDDAHPAGEALGAPIHIDGVTRPAAAEAPAAAPAADVPAAAPEAETPEAETPEAETPEAETPPGDAPAAAHAPDAGPPSSDEAGEAAMPAEPPEPPAAIRPTVVLPLAAHPARHPVASGCTAAPAAPGNDLRTPPPPNAPMPAATFPDPLAKALANARGDRVAPFVAPAAAAGRVGATRAAPPGRAR